MSDPDPFAPPTEEEASRRSQAHPSPTEQMSPDALDAVRGPADTWQRTSPLQLVVAPVRSLANLALPFVVVLFVGGGQRGMIGTLGFVVPIAVLVVLGSLVPWLGTRWRIADGRLEQTYRVLSTKQTSVTLDRVRSVDLESTLMHRVLGLSVVKIGTGVDDERITLDSLRTSDALELQEFLLRRSGAGTHGAPGTHGDGGGDAAADREDAADHDPRTPSTAPAGAREVLARFDWSWLRFAPLQVSQLVALAAAFGVFAQVADDLPINAQDVVETARGQVERLGVLVAVALILLVVVVGYLVAAVGAYAVRWYGLVVSRDAENLRVEAGLLTTRSVTVEWRRIRGLELTEPALVRLASGAQLAALATGVGSGGTTQVLPSVPRPVAVEVGDQVLAASAALTMPLREHGPQARRRRQVRGQLVAVPLAAASGAIIAVASYPWWAFVVPGLLLAAGSTLAELSYRHLGHALTRDHLVSRRGVLGVSTTVLERDGVIGWTITQTWFQRRVGLCHLAAATAAGSEQVVVVDVRLEVATALAQEVTPSLVSPFTAP